MIEDDVSSLSKTHCSPLCTRAGLLCVGLLPLFVRRIIQYTVRHRPYKALRDGGERGELGPNPM